MKTRRKWARWTTEANPFSLGCSYPLGLPLVDKLSFRLRHVGQQLQHDIRYQRSHQIPAFPCI